MTNESQPSLQFLINALTKIPYKEFNEYNRDTKKLFKKYQKLVQFKFDQILELGTNKTIATVAELAKETELKGMLDLTYQVFLLGNDTPFQALIGMIRSAAFQDNHFFSYFANEILDLFPRDDAYGLFAVKLYSNQEAFTAEIVEKACITARYKKGMYGLVGNLGPLYVRHKEVFKKYMVSFLEMYQYPHLIDAKHESSVKESIVCFLAGDVAKNEWEFIGKYATMFARDVYSGGPTLLRMIADATSVDGSYFAPYADIFLDALQTISSVDYQVGFIITAIIKATCTSVRTKLDLTKRLLEAVAASPLERESVASFVYEISRFKPYLIGPISRTVKELATTVQHQQTKEWLQLIHRCYEEDEKIPCRITLENIALLNLDKHFDLTIGKSMTLKEFKEYLFEQIRMEGQQGQNTTTSTSTSGSSSTSSGSDAYSSMQERVDAETIARIVTVNYEDEDGDRIAVKTQVDFEEMFDSFDEEQSEFVNMLVYIDRHAKKELIASSFSLSISLHPAQKETSESQATAVYISNTQVKYTKGTLVHSYRDTKTYAAIDQQTGEMLLVKETALKNKFTAQELLAFKKQYEERDEPLMKQDGGKSLVPIVGLDLSDQTLTVVEPRASNGSLKQQIAEFGRIPHRLVLLYTRQILERLKLLMSTGMLTSYLSTANMMLQGSGAIQISEYGIVGAIKAELYSHVVVTDLSTQLKRVGAIILEMMGVSTRNEVEEENEALVEVLDMCLAADDDEEDEDLSVIDRLVSLLQ